MKKTLDNNDNTEVKETKVTEVGGVKKDEVHLKNEGKSVETAKDVQSGETQTQEGTETPIQDKGTETPIQDRTETPTQDAETFTQTQTGETLDGPENSLPEENEERILSDLDQNTDSELLENKNENVLSELSFTEPETPRDSSFESEHISQSSGDANSADINTDIKIDNENAEQKELTENEDYKIENGEQVETVKAESMEQKEEPKSTENENINEKKSETGVLQFNLFI